MNKITQYIIVAVFVSLLFGFIIGVTVQEVDMRYQCEMTHSNLEACDSLYIQGIRRNDHLLDSIDALHVILKYQYTVIHHHLSFQEKVTRERRGK